MAKAKTAPLESSLIARKGTAVPAQTSPMTSAPIAAEKPHEEPIALTVKLEPELYFQLKRRGVQRLGGLGQPALQDRDISPSLPKPHQNFRDVYGWLS